MTDEDLRFNVLNHEIVPHHEVVPEDELKTVLAKYDIVKEQLPRIKSNDPAVKVVGGEVGQVVKIVRRSPTAGRFNAYRLVVEAI